jgi:hypothetical protein
MYGTVAGVAALSSLWTENGKFLDETVYVEGTKPSASQVEDWLVEITAMLDLCLEDEGFITPVTVADVIVILGSKCQAIAKDMCDFSHDSGQSPIMTIENELREWVKQRAVGFENMGVQRRDNGRNVAYFDVL